MNNDIKLIEASKTLGGLLTLHGYRLKTAESFTGGLISSAITMVEGASNYFAEGIVCYSATSKIERLRVNPFTISQLGVASCAVIKEMLDGLISSGADVAIATTGNAGPTAESGRAGVCFTGAAVKERMIIQKSFFSGGRGEVIFKGALSAIESAINLLSNN